MLSAVVGAALTPSYGDTFPWTALFDAIDVDNITWEQDRAGAYVGSSYVFGTPRELYRQPQ